LCLVEGFRFAPLKKHDVSIQHGNTPLICVDVMNDSIDANEHCLSFRPDSDAVANSEFSRGADGSTFEKNFTQHIRSTVKLYCHRTTSTVRSQTQGMAMEAGKDPLSEIREKR
jgi:hypothetical protein